MAPLSHETQERIICLPHRARKPLPQNQSPLFRLPTELRLEIYALCLISQDPIIEPLPQRKRFLNGHMNYTDARNLPPLGASLAATCRRIHKELDLRPLYRDNTFVFSTPLQANIFLSPLNPRHRDEITTITIDLRACLDGNGEATPSRELGWYEYLACPTTHYRSNNNTHCTTLACQHLLFDHPNIQHVVLDARAALKQALSRSEVSRILNFLLRGTCSGAGALSTSKTCRPDLTVTVLPAAAQETPNCFTCSKKPDRGEPWVPMWLCSGDKAGECREKFGEVGKGEALPLVIDRNDALFLRVERACQMKNAGYLEFDSLGRVNGRPKRS